MLRNNGTNRRRHSAVTAQSWCAPVDATIGARGRGSGSHDPYKALKTTLKAEIDEDVWSTVHPATLRVRSTSPSRRIAVKVINHLGDEGFPGGLMSEENEMSGSDAKVPDPARMGNRHDY
jgi:hypothetical protein